MCLHYAGARPLFGLLFIRVYMSGPFPRTGFAALEVSPYMLHSATLAAHSLSHPSGSDENEQVIQTRTP